MKRSSRGSPRVSPTGFRRSASVKYDLNKAGEFEQGKAALPWSVPTSPLPQILKASKSMPNRFSPPALRRVGLSSPETIGEGGTSRGEDLVKSLRLDFSSLVCTAGGEMQDQRWPSRSGPLFLGLKTPLGKRHAKSHQLEDLLSDEENEPCLSCQADAKCRHQQSRVDPTDRNGIAVGVDSRNDQSRLAAGACKTAFKVMFVTDGGMSQDGTRN